MSLIAYFGPALWALVEVEGVLSEAELAEGMFAASGD